MTQHQYWGKVEADWAGFSAGKQFISTHFDNIPITVFLGSEYDDEGEEVETTPTKEELDDFQITYSNFLSNLDKIMEEIKQQTFTEYLKLYAHYYENEEKSGEKPLNIDSAEKHFMNLKEVLYLRVLPNGTIKIPFRYKIDTEHGMEVRLNNNIIRDIGGIAET